MKILKRINPKLLLILFAAVVLRFVLLDEAPPSLNWDETSHGYNAYSILTTGKDEWGEDLPLIFRAFGDYKLPVYIYLTSLSVFAFGLNELAVRMPSIVAGVMHVAGAYFLALELFGYLGRELKRKKGLVFDVFVKYGRNTALLTALLVAVGPWDIFLSRWAFEANVGQALLVWGAYFFLKGLKDVKFFVPSSFLLGLSVWTYNSQRVFAPLLVAFLVVLFLKGKKDFFSKARFSKGRVYLALSAFFVAVFFLPMFFQLFSSEGMARYSKVSIIDEGAISRINELRGQKDLPGGLGRLFYNKGTFFAFISAGNFISYLDPSFWFLRGGSQYQYNVVGSGLYYPASLPFFLLGLGLFLYCMRGRSKAAGLVVFWVFASLIPASITRDGGYALRVVTVLPMVNLLTAAGACLFFVWLSKRSWTLLLPAKVALLVVLLFSLEGYMSHYVEDYSKDYSWSWQWGHRQMVEFVKARYDSYDKIIITKKYGEPHIFLLFYWPWEPGKYREDGNLIRYEQTGWWWVDRFDKFYFVNDWEIPLESDNDFVLESGLRFDCEREKCLLVTSPGTYQNDYRLLESIYFLDGTRAFDMVDNLPKQ